jgi:hypothetical protein
MNVQFSSASRYQFVPQSQNTLIPETTPAPAQDSFVRFGKLTKRDAGPLAIGSVAGVAAFWGAFWGMFPQVGEAIEGFFGNIF